MIANLTQQDLYVSNTVLNAFNILTYLTFMTTYYYYLHLADGRMKYKVVCFEA